MIFLIMALEGRFLKIRLGQVSQLLTLYFSIGFLMVEAVFVCFYDTNEILFTFRSKSALLGTALVFFILLYFLAWSDSKINVRARNLVLLFFINGQFLMLSNTLLYLLIIIELLSYLLVLFFVSRRALASSQYLLNYLAFGSLLNILFFLILLAIFASSGTTSLPMLLALKTPMVLFFMYALIAALLLKIGVFPLFI